MARTRESCRDPTGTMPESWRGREKATELLMWTQSGTGGERRPPCGHPPTVYTWLVTALQQGVCGRGDTGRAYPSVSAEGWPFQWQPPELRFPLPAVRSSSWAPTPPHRRPLTDNQELAAFPVSSAPGLPAYPRLQGVTHATTFAAGAWGCPQQRG